MFDPRTNREYVLDYTDPNELSSWIRVPEKDMARPGIAISFVNAAMHIPAHVIEGAKDICLFIVNFHGHMDPVKYPTWTNWCIAGRIECHSGEIREVAFDADKLEWTSPWFDLDTGLVAESHRFKAA